MYPGGGPVGDRVILDAELELRGGKGGGTKDSVDFNSVDESTQRGCMIENRNTIPCMRCFIWSQSSVTL